jgi:threonine aldolase
VSQPDLASSPVEQLADHFWEAILELNPTTATVYGDERYADRLEDPGPRRGG